MHQVACPEIARQSRIQSRSQAARPSCATRDELGTKLRDEFVSIVQKKITVSANAQDVGHLHAHGFSLNHTRHAAHQRLNRAVVFSVRDHLALRALEK